MLVVWTKTASTKVLATFAPVLRTVPHLPVKVVADYSVPTGTTTILALGGDALKQLQAEKILAKNRTVTGYRTRPQMRDGVPVLVSYSPDIGDIDHGYFVDLLTDLSLAIRHSLTGQWTPQYGSYAYVPDFGPFCAAIEAQYEAQQDAVDLMFDLETLGLDPYAPPTPTFPGAYIVTMQASWQAGRAEVVRFANREDAITRLANPILREQVQFLLNSPKVRVKGADFKYDQHWLAVHAWVLAQSFTFDTTLVGSLLNENRSNSLDLHTKVYVPAMGGYADCVDPDALVLTADLRKIKAKDLKAGDELCAFSVESPDGKKAQRRVMKKSLVLDTQVLERPRLRITTASGRVTIVSRGHLMLSKRDAKDAGGGWRWRQAKNLQVGSLLKSFPWLDEDHTFEAGYICGLLDGEGWVSGRPPRVGFAQKAGVVLQEFVRIVTAGGIKIGHRTDLRKDVPVVNISFDSTHAWEVLQRYRPSRLLLKDWWEESCIPAGHDCVVSIDELGEGSVIGLRTTTQTLIADGICSHNSFNATVDKGRMDKVPPAALLPYAGGDVDAGLQVANVLKRELLRDEKLTRFYVNILHPASQAFSALERGGVVVDLPAFKELQADLEAEHAKLVKAACKIMGGRIVVKHGDLRRTGGMNLTKASMLCDFMFSPMGLNLKPKMWTEKPDKDGIKRPSTAMEHLEMFATDPKAKEFVAIIQEDSSLMKTHDTFVVGFLEHLRSDGRFHPTYFLFVGDKLLNQGGAKTGRLSAKGPAWQVIPKHTKWAKRIRRCFPAPPGYVVVERDYSSGELRVAACIANELNMIKAFKAGRDMHADTAGPFRGYTYDAMMALKLTDVELFDAIRQLGKAGNFGLLFGMGAEGFMIYAERNYGVSLTFEEADTFRTGFFDRYPGLPVYHRDYKERARRDKQVRTPLGRIRHLPLITSPNQEVRSKAERQAINSPVQGTLTDMTLWSLALEHKAGLHDIAPAFGSTHDSMTNYVPEDRVDEIVTRQLDIMQNLPFDKLGWVPQLQFKADAKVGPNLGDLKAWK